MAGYSSQSKFLGDFVKDELDCHYATVEDFGCSVDNENNDIPLYDQYNRGLALCEQGMERKNLATEGQPRGGLTGYIPSMEQAQAYPGTSPRPEKVVIALGVPSEQMKMESMKRRGLIR